MAANPAPTDPAVTGPDEPSDPGRADSSVVIEPLDGSGPPHGAPAPAPADPAPGGDHGAPAQGMIPARGRRRTKVEAR